MTSLLLLTLVLQVTPPQVTVYAFTKTDVSGFVDSNQTQRLQAVASLRKYLGKKKGLTVVDEAAHAELTVEVLGLSRKETGTEINWDGGLTTKVRKPAVHVMLRAGEYALEIEGVSVKPKFAADAVAQEIERWVKANRTLLTRARLEHETAGWR